MQGQSCHCRVACVEHPSRPIDAACLIVSCSVTVSKLAYIGPWRLTVNVLPSQNRVKLIWAVHVSRAS